MSSNMSSSDGDRNKPGSSQGLSQGLSQGSSSGTTNPGSSTQGSSTLGPSSVDPTKGQNKNPVQKRHYVGKSSNKNQQVKHNINSDKSTKAISSSRSTKKQSQKPFRGQIRGQVHGSAQKLSPRKLSPTLAQVTENEENKKDGIDNSEDNERDSWGEQTDGVEINNDKDVNEILNMMFGRSITQSAKPQDFQTSQKMHGVDRSQQNGQIRVAGGFNENVQQFGSSNEQSLNHPFSQPLNHPFNSQFNSQFNPQFNQPSGQPISYPISYHQGQLPQQYSAPFYNNQHIGYMNSSMGGNMSSNMSGNMNGFNQQNANVPNIQTMSMIKDVADRIDSLTIGINGNNIANQQLMRAQTEMTNMLINQIGRLMTQNDEMYNAVRSLRNELDTLRRSVSEGFLGVEKDMNVLQRRMLRRFEKQETDIETGPSNFVPPGYNHNSSPGHYVPIRGPVGRRLVPPPPNFMMDPSAQPPTHTTISITPISANSPFFRQNIPQRPKIKEDEKKTPRSSDTKKTDKKKTAPVRVQSSAPGVFPFVIMSELMKMSKDGGDDDDEKENNDVFKEVQTPDLNRELYKCGDRTDLENFEQLTFTNLEDFKTQGQKFIDAIDEHNKEIDKLKKEQEKSSKAVIKAKKSRKNESDESDDKEENEDSEGEDTSDDEDIMEKVENEFMAHLFANMLGIPREAIVDIEDENPEDQNVPIKITTRNTAKDSSKDTTRDTNKKSIKSTAADTKTEKKKPIKKKMSIDAEIPKDKDGLYTFMGKRYSVDPRKLMKLVKPIQLLNSMIGMSEVKEELFKFVSNFLYNSRNNGMLNTAIYGKPGIGKTDLGKILCMIYSALELVPSAKFKLVKASELIGQYVGQTRQKTKRVLEEADGGVLFIDEAYALTSGSGEKGALYGKECIDTINQELSENRRKLIVIIAGYENEIKEGFFKVNQGLERRFPFRYVLKDYTKEEMKDIFIRMLRLNDDVYLYRDPKDIEKDVPKDTTKDVPKDVEKDITKNVESSISVVEQVVGSSSDVSLKATETQSNDKSETSSDKDDTMVKASSSNEDKSVETTQNTSQDSTQPKQKKAKRVQKGRVPLVGSVTEQDIVDMFEDMRYFNNCGGDIENLITHIGFANSKRTVGKHPGAKNIYTREDLRCGLESFKKHKAQIEDNAWQRMFL